MLLLVSDSGWLNALQHGDRRRERRGYSAIVANDGRFVVCDSCREIASETGIGCLVSVCCVAISYAFRYLGRRAANGFDFKHPEYLVLCDYAVPGWAVRECN